MAQCGYQVEITGTDNSSQNGKVERPHQTLAAMMRSSLVNDSLHKKYWSDALLHSVFVKNRLPHFAFKFKSTPYTALTGVKPNLSNLKIFGSQITVRKPGLCHGKVNSHHYSGIFLRYAKTMKNYVYIDINTNKIKTASHAVFDEAHYSQQSKPRGDQILMGHGYVSNVDTPPTPVYTRPTIKVIIDSSTTLNTTNNLTIVPTTPDAIIPRQATDKSAGYDLYSVTTSTIAPDSLVKFDTGIKVQLPPGTYGRIASRSGLVFKHQINVQAGISDSDYTGTLQVLLYNFGTTSYTVHKGDRIAQLILEKYASPHVTLYTEIPDTQSGDNGFGSTELNSRITDNRAKPSIHTLQSCDLTMSMSSPLDLLDISIKTNHPHETLGLIFNTDMILLSCTTGTPAAKLKGWRHTLKGTRLARINGMKVTTKSQVIQHIDRTKPTNAIQFASLSQTPIHPETGTT